LGNRAGGDLEAAEAPDLRRLVKDFLAIYDVGEERSKSTEAWYRWRDKFNAAIAALRAAVTTPPTGKGVEDEAPDVSR
jgi:hypothetical protein